MANPNSSVSAYRNRATVTVLEEVIRKSGEAEARRDELRKEYGAGYTVRMSAFRTGSRKIFPPLYNYVVRVYQRK